MIEIKDHQLLFHIAMLSEHGNDCQFFEVLPNCLDLLPVIKSVFHSDYYYTKIYYHAENNTVYHTRPIIKDDGRITINEYDPRWNDIDLAIEKFYENGCKI